MGDEVFCGLVGAKVLWGDVSAKVFCGLVCAKEL